MTSLFSDLKFGIFISAALPMTSELTLRAIPTFHVMGDTDALVTIDKSVALANAFEDAIADASSESDTTTRHAHPGGHYVPSDARLRHALKHFVKTQQQSLL